MFKETLKDRAKINFDITNGSCVDVELWKKGFTKTTVHKFSFSFRIH